MTIGIIEDDLLVNQALDIALQNAGYHTTVSYTHLDVYKRQQQLTI